MTHSLSPTSPTVKNPGTSSTIPSATCSIPSPVAKPSLKVSFKDRIRNLQHADKTQASTSTIQKEAMTLEIPTTDSMKEQLIPSSSSDHSSKPSKPSSTISLKEKIKSFSQPKEPISEQQSSLKPWSKLKLATVVSAGGSYSSLNNSVCEDSPTGAQTFPSTSTPTTEKPPPTIVPININKNEKNKKLSNIISNSSSSSSTSSTKPTHFIQSSSIKKPIDDISINLHSESKIKLIDKQLSDITSVSDSELKSSSRSYYKKPLQSHLRNFYQTSADAQNHHEQQKNIIDGVDKLGGFKLRLRPSKLSSSNFINQQSRAKQKFYRSVDDLSPEYGGLPFVKKLKILNERQKLAELESVIQTRSFSLDCTDSGNNLIDDLMEPLTRSHSEASAMGRPNSTPSSMIGEPSSLSIQQQCLNSSTITQQSNNRTLPLPLSFPTNLSSTQLPLSPESNETLERRQLKSILKKLSEDKMSGRVTNLDDSTKIGSTSNAAGTLSSLTGRNQQQLMREPTLEGYVARHSKLMKSVTFNNTLSSPPDSANTCESIENRSLFPLLSAQPLDNEQSNFISTDQHKQQDDKEIPLHPKHEEQSTPSPKQRSQESPILHQSSESLSENQIISPRIPSSDEIYKTHKIIESPTKNSNFLQANQKMILKGNFLTS